VLFALVYLLLRRVVRLIAGSSNEQMYSEVELVVLRHRATGSSPFCFLLMTEFIGRGLDLGERPTTATPVMRRERTSSSTPRLPNTQAGVGIACYGWIGRICG
jgi:hypothetical protein